MTKANPTKKREHLLKFLSKKCSLHSKCYIVFYPVNYSYCVTILQIDTKNCCQFVVNSDLGCRKPLILLGFLVQRLHCREPLVGTHLFPNDPQLTTIRTPILRSRSPNSKSFAINLGYLEKKLEKVENVLHCSAKLTLIQFLLIYNSTSILIFQVV